MPFYAVANGRNTGIFTNWNDCKNSVNGYRNAKYKKFDTKEEANYFFNKNKRHTNDDNIQSQNKCKDSLDESGCIETNKDNYNAEQYVYTDGSCVNNGTSNAIAGIGIYFGINDNRNVSKKLKGKQTNNTSEISAIIEVYHIIESDIKKGYKIVIVSDSEYAIKCCTTYGKKCDMKGWVEDIPNKVLVKNAYELYKDKPNVKFMHIKSHTNNTDKHSIGNYNADKLANLSIGLEKCPYEKTDRIYLNVPFVKKEDIKKFGGKWDKDKKKWFVFNNNKDIETILSLFKEEFV